MKEHRIFNTNNYFVAVLIVVLSICVGYFLAPGGSPQVNGVDSDTKTIALELGQKHEIGNWDSFVFCGVTESDGSLIITVLDGWGNGFATHNIYIRNYMMNKPNIWIFEVEYKIISASPSQIVLEKIG